MDSDNYCRLCAELKHVRKLVDLQSNPEKCRDIIDKLTRVNAQTEFIDTKLPSTVCHDCIRALDKCFEFVLGVECAQSTLAEVVARKNVKMELEEVEASFLCEDVSEGDVAETLDVKDIKTEEVPDEARAADVADAAAAAPKPRKARRGDSLDSIPLSQLKARDSWAGFSWMCTRCRALFQNVEDLKTHSLAVHSICNPWRCNMRSGCHVRKQGLAQFLAHVQKHNKLLRRSCFKCFEKFDTIEKTLQHRETHLDSDIYCPGCHTTFDNNDELSIHKKLYFDYTQKKEVAVAIPATAVSGRTCLLCSKSFKSKTNVRLHILRMHTERRAEHICDVCGRAFYDKHTQAQHMLHVHTDYRPHKCHICKLCFKTPKSLKDHIGRHFNEKPLACDKCGKNFRLRKHLKKHSVIHTDALPFQCNYCEKRFQRKQYLTNHLLQHTGEKPYSCEPCQQHFASWGNYNKHMICRHNQDMARKKPVLVDSCVDEL